MNRVVYGVRPVLEAIRGEQRIDRILIARAQGGQTQRIRAEAKKARIKVSEVPKEELNKRAGTDGHQGVLACLDTNEVEITDVESLLERAEAQGVPPLIVLLDGIQDPQNLGAIIRSAHALGAHGVVIPKDRSAQVTPAVVRASAGAALHLPIARVTNLKHALERLSLEDVWTAAAVLDGTPAEQARLDGPLAIVIGGEAKGVRPVLAKRCDMSITVPLSEGFDSLNASVAAGILLYEANRQRRASKA